MSMDDNFSSLKKDTRRPKSKDELYLESGSIFSAAIQLNCRPDGRIYDRKRQIIDRSNMIGQMPSSLLIKVLAQWFRVGSMALS
jgi:hypothetical protein